MRDGGSSDRVLKRKNGMWLIGRTLTYTCSGNTRARKEMELERGRPMVTKKKKGKGTGWYGPHANTVLKKKYRKTRDFAIGGTPGATTDVF